MVREKLGGAPRMEVGNMLVLAPDDLALWNTPYILILSTRQRREIPRVDGTETNRVLLLRRGKFHRRLQCTRCQLVI